MIAEEKTIIYISDNIGETSNIFQAIKKLCKIEIDCQLYEIIRGDDLWKVEESKYRQIRFACITPQTDSHLTSKLLTQEELIPILLIGNGDIEKYEKLLVSERKLNSDDVKRMIYSVKSVKEISGALKWVHNYYYQLREFENEIKNEKNRIREELRKEIQAETMGRSLAQGFRRKA